MICQNVQMALWSPENEQAKQSSVCTKHQVIKYASLE